MKNGEIRNIWNTNKNSECIENRICKENKEQNKEQKENNNCRGKESIGKLGNLRRKVDRDSPENMVIYGNVWF